MRLRGAGVCIQGLVLLVNQWLLFVELVGFVNNAFFMSQSACLSANVPSEFLFVWFCCWFVCMWIRVSEHNPLIVRHVQIEQFYIRRMWAFVWVFVTYSMSTNYLVVVCGKSWAERGLLAVFPNGAFHSPAIHVTVWWRWKGEPRINGVEAVPC